MDGLQYSEGAESLTQGSRRFQFLRLIASGGFGDVYLCKELNPSGLGRMVALKLLKSRWKDNEEIAARVRDEARLLALLRHRNIINVYDLTSVQGRTAIVMEFLDAVDLSRVLEEMKKKEWTIPLRVALEIVASGASALDAAYNQPPFPGDKPLRVIHRDIKPSNIMVDAGGMVKVLDFGVARSEFEARESQTRELQFGSLDYMAPERLFFEPETPASDIYSLAVTLYELLAFKPLGKAAARAQQHSEMVEEKIDALLSSLKEGPAICKELGDLLRSGLSFDVSERLNAVEFSQRARNLGRSLQGADLVSWAERAIPFIQEAIGDFLVNGGGSLRGTILNEDSTAIRRRMEESEHGDVVDGIDREALRRGALAQVDSVPIDIVENKATEVFDPFRTTSPALPEESLTEGAHRAVDDITASVTATDMTQSDFMREDPPSEEMDSSLHPIVANPTPMSMPADEDPEYEDRLWKGLVGMGVSIVFVSFLAAASFWLLQGDSGIEEAVPVVESPVPENALVFTATIPMKKLEATCGGEKVKDPMRVVIPISADGSCIVKGIGQDRMRYRVELEGLEAGKYECFSAGEEGCRRVP
jgi:serine/threonine protein kinase